MEGLSLLITVLQEKSVKDIINLFKYKAGYYYVWYPALLNYSNNSLELHRDIGVCRERP